MGNEIVTDWDNEKIATFGSRPMRFRHRAHESGLFSDDALARLIERSPRENYYVNTMDIASNDRRTRREGEFGGASGAEVLEAVRSGHIWVMLLYPEKVDGRYGELLEAIYAEMSAKVPHLKVKRKKISILVSSPNIPVFYHCDLAGQTLWQVRGEKTVYVYPNREPYLPQPNLERIVLNEAHEISLPYDRAWDASAEVFTIGPGDMLHWPLNAPHRVQNGNCVNVSFTTEHVTPEVRRNYAVHYGNGILRRVLNLQRLSPSTSGPNYWTKLATMAAARALSLQKGREQVFKVDFEVDPKAPGGFRDIPAHEFRK
ncbi:MAG: hypothetical protein AB1749_02345 [Pseudomonadota bacterium]